MCENCCWMPPACPGGDSRSPLKRGALNFCGCHRLARWRLTFLAICFGSSKRDLHGASPWHPRLLRQLGSSSQRETPPDKPRASSRSFLRICIIGFCSDRRSRVAEIDPALPRLSENCCGCPRLVRGRFTLAARMSNVNLYGCHRLARWRLTFFAICFGC